MARAERFSAAGRMRKTVSKTFYITTPLYYANAPLHIGHAYSTIAADVYKRWMKMSGVDVFFLTGMDEHGEKIYASAQKAGVNPQEWVDSHAEDAKKLWKFLNISYDGFIRTTEKKHIDVVSSIFKKLVANGDIYSAVYEGPYCVPCESFFTAAQVSDAEGLCPECGRPMSEIKKENAYFFKLKKYEKKLLDYYDAHPDFLSPRDKANKTIDTVRCGLNDLCVSREKVTWGIPVPGDEKKTIYVWLDALINYISAAGYGSEDESVFERLWPADCHIVGKEIYYFHTVVWPALLMACGLALPRKVFGHGWWTLSDDKISKSKGNVVTPYEICEVYPVDALRFFLLREMPFGTDGAFSKERLKERYTADLSNSLGNLFRRTEVMLAKYFAGKTPPDGKVNAAIAEKEKRVLDKTAVYMKDLGFHGALNEIWGLINEANRFIEEKKPWFLFKEKSSELKDVMMTLADCLGFFADILNPFMPAKSAEMARHLGKEPGTPRVCGFPNNHKVPGGEVIFPQAPV